ncbi:histone-lysine N-methyltransferase PR-Set7-like [Leptopilina heterotoma]|uniref:histone-lysine N-methyltransferase PR-Set7-like n=1 Tax=Leptopilina heterotoma TaxID=63436 RepID=UPI001CA890C4|nr:histone-lysine N-methyltransferase PR-Set7-like [Leptopilina heterotoma]
MRLRLHKLRQAEATLIEYTKSLTSPFGPTKRVPWSKGEKNCVLETFGEYVQKHNLPKAKDIEALKRSHSVLNNRSIAQIKTWLNNQQQKFRSRHNTRSKIKNCSSLEVHRLILEEKILSCSQDGLAIKNFPGKGRGIITKRAFYKNEFIVEYIGDLIKEKLGYQREKYYEQNGNYGSYLFFFAHKDQRYCIDATIETDRYGRLINHSRKGQLKPIVVPHLMFVAKQDILKEKEVTYDYGDRRCTVLENNPWREKTLAKDTILSTMGEPWLKTLPCLAWENLDLRLYHV